MQLDSGTRHSHSGGVLILSAASFNIFRGWWRCPGHHQCRQNQQHTCLLVACWKNKFHYWLWLIVRMSALMYCTNRLPELVNQVSSDTCSWGTEGMSDRDSSTVHIAFIWIQTKSLSDSQVLRGKSLIHLGKNNSINCKSSVINKTKCKCNATPEGYKVGYIYPFFVFALRFSLFIVSVISALCVTNLHKIHVFDSETSFFKSFCDCRNRAYKI